MSKVYLYIVDSEIYNDEKEFEKELDKYSHCRQKKIMECRSKIDKKLSLAAAQAVDSGLARYGLKERNAVYSYNNYGKPYFQNYSDIYFNVSHSGQYAAAVFSTSETGIDIQKIQKSDNKLWKRCLSASEYAYIEELNDISDKNDYFFRLWALKESFIKASGKGLSAGLENISFEIGKEINVNQNIDIRNFWFYELNCLAGYKIAVCSTENIKQEEIVLWEKRSIME